MLLDYHAPAELRKVNLRPCQRRQKDASRMRLALIPMAALAAANCAMPLHAAGLPQLSFQHHDWELVCDNTRTCRAAGYHAEDGRHPPLSVLLERRSGPGEAFVGRLRLGEADDGIDLPAPAVAPPEYPPPPPGAPNCPAPPPPYPPALRVS